MMAVTVSAWQTNVPMRRFTSLKVGGPADFFSAPRSIESLRADLEEATRRGIPVTVLGGGSNLLVSDNGIAGLVIRPSETQIVIHENGEAARVTAGAAVALAALARRLARAGWRGLEWAANVPGTVGGAVVNNAGAFDSCVQECLASAELLFPSMAVRTINVGDLDYAYRTSALKRRELGPVVVLRATFCLRRGSPEAATALVRDLQQRRTSSQPRVLSAGSVFANPPGVYSGRLIEQSGLKSARRGDAEISSVHANFIVNHGAATADDVYQLMRAAQSRVWQTHRIWLRPEIELAGRWRPSQLETLRAPGTDE